MSFWCKNQYDVIIDLMNLSFPALKELCTNKTFSWHTISNHWKSNLDTYYHFHIIRKRGSKSIILFLGDYRHYVLGIIKKNKKSEICYLFSSYFIQNGNLIIILFITFTKDRYILSVKTIVMAHHGKKLNLELHIPVYNFHLPNLVLEKDNIRMKYMRFAICYSL